MKLITRKEAMHITGYSKTHWQRLVNSGQAPKPEDRIGRNWLYEERAVIWFARHMGRTPRLESQA